MATGHGAGQQWFASQALRVRCLMLFGLRPVWKGTSVHTTYCNMHCRLCRMSCPAVQSGGSQFRICPGYHLHPDRCTWGCTWLSCSNSSLVKFWASPCWDWPVAFALTCRFGKALPEHCRASVFELIELRTAPRLCCPGVGLVQDEVFIGVGTRLDVNVGAIIKNSARVLGTLAKATSARGYFELPERSHSAAFDAQGSILSTREAKLRLPNYAA